MKSVIHTTPANGFYILTSVRKLAATISLAVRKELAWRRLQRAIREADNGQFVDIDSLKDLR